MYRAWHFLTELQRIDGITRERHGGIPHQVAPGATTDTTDPTSDWYLARQAVEQFQVNEQSGLSCLMGGRKICFPWRGQPGYASGPGRL